MHSAYFKDLRTQTALKNVYFELYFSNLRYYISDYIYYSCVQYERCRK